MEMEAEADLRCRNGRSPGEAFWVDEPRWRGFRRLYGLGVEEERGVYLSSLARVRQLTRKVIVRSG